MKYFIKTFGCQMNISDSQRIETLLKENDLEKTSQKEEADLIIVNMCSVRESAVDRVYGVASDFEKLKKKNPELTTVLTGCLTEEDKEKMEEKFDYILKKKDIPNWPKILWDKKEKPVKKKIDYLKITPQLSSSGLVPVSDGCSHQCTYCVVPLTRGKLQMRPVEQILDGVKRMVDEGIKEIWLLGQIVNQYNYKGTDFADLLEKVNNIEGDFWLRFTSPHPSYFSDKLIKKMSTLEKVTPYVNLPVQSGNDEILKRMRRGYTRERYLKTVKKLKEEIPNIGITTDIIVGFPGETKEQFRDTLSLLEKVKFDMAYIARFSPRPGTQAEKMEDTVPYEEKKRREKVLTEKLEEIGKKKNKNYVGKNQKVLPFKRRDDYVFGKNPQYKTVKFKSEKFDPYNFAKVKITKADSFGLEGKLKSYE